MSEESDERRRRRLSAIFEGYDSLVSRVRDLISRGIPPKIEDVVAIGRYPGPNARATMNRLLLARGDLREKRIERAHARRREELRRADPDWCDRDPDESV